MIAEDETEYGRRRGEGWKKSSDWGKTGSIVEGEKEEELNFDASLVDQAFAKRESHDPSQGGFVWKSISKSQADTFENYTYEVSREHPKPDGVYPRYTFIKYKNTKDGELLLTDFTAQLKGNGGPIPVEIHFECMIMIPADQVKIQVAKPKDGATGKP